MATNTKQTGSFFKSSYFWKQLGFIILTFALIILIVGFTLKLFTKHGQSIGVPNLVGKSIEDAEDITDDLGLDIEVIDSVFMVGKKPFEVIRQYPETGVNVKSGRVVYVSVTKEVADKIPLSRLPILYGKSYERKKKELENGFEIKSKIVAHQFDAGPPGFILAVIYEGDTIINSASRRLEVMIPKGGTLEFVVSKPDGGEVRIPDLVCKTLDEVEFFLSTIYIDPEYSDVDLVNKNPKRSLYVASQNPSAGSQMIMGEKVHLTVSTSKPAICVAVDEPVAKDKINEESKIEPKTESKKPETKEVKPEIKKPEAKKPEIKKPEKKVE